MDMQKHFRDVLTSLYDRPPPHARESTPPLLLNSRETAANTKHFEEFVESLLPLTLKSQRDQDKKAHLAALKIITHTLIQCMFRWESVALPKSPDAYTKGRYLNHIGLTRRIVVRCIDSLCGGEEYLEDPDTGWMYQLRCGFLSPNGINQAAQFFPTKQFMNMFFESLYTDFGGWDDMTDDKLYIFKDVPQKDIPPISSYQDKLAIIRNYNNFMRDHSWAMKSPSYRSMSKAPQRGGRIYNHFQNIANRRFPLRATTLIDGYPIAEPDFTANHLWMFSKLHGEELPDDPYNEIVKITGCTRDQVKSVTTVMLGARNLKQKGKTIADASKRKIACSSDNMRSILSALESTYPWLAKHNAFYNDTGSKLQFLEGEIALEMMAWATSIELPLLVVHDAFAVPEQHEAMVYEKMLETRSSVPSKFETI
ncbi:hypothetical protein E3W66_08745 [Gammaproteobacteria bacterium LSUCC0057]|uniref:Uncharacterized protein n=1 Tax=Gammaproteobacteria bacterium LSUCC0057 TaxID=2559237 RepID=A0A4Y8UHC1_9GAMM|nr:hypothetical protein E3W66_08745 [Gammaproteobacteria bacterium LSUCC0057]